MLRYLLPIAPASGAAILGFTLNDNLCSPMVHCNGAFSGVHVERTSGITVLYSNKSDFDKKLQRFVTGGHRQLQVVSDFDFTMTRFRIGNSRGASCHRLIEGSGFLQPHIVQQADALFNYYYPLEVDPTLPMTEKVEHMTTWATKAAELMVDSGLKKYEIKLAVSEALKSNTFSLRKEVPVFIRSLADKGVPLLLFSAGIGDIIEEALIQTLNDIPSDVHVVSNHMIFKGNKLVSWTEPVFHVFNKKASSALHSSFFKKFDLAHRKNVLLIGDSMGDVAMSEGLNCSQDSILRVGFLNDKVERLPDYLAVYDVVILGDPGFDYINDTILKPILVDLK